MNVITKTEIYNRINTVCQELKWLDLIPKFAISEKTTEIINIVIIRKQELLSEMNFYQVRLKELMKKELAEQQAATQEQSQEITEDGN